MDLVFVQGRMRLERPFTIARGTQTQARSVFLRIGLTRQGPFGYGEVPLDDAVGWEDTSFQLRQAVRHLFAAKGSRAADFANPLGKRAGPVASGLDTALADLHARIAGVPLHQHLGLARASMPTSVTVSVGAPEAMANEARGYVERGFRVLKVKLGSVERPDPEGDAARLAAVRDAVPDIPIRIDANAAWTPDSIRRVLPQLRAAEVELIEQPFPPGREAELVALVRSAEIPVAADESAQSLADVRKLGQLGFGERHGEGVGVVNVKIGKFGGPRPGLEAARTARDAGMRVFLGCFIESAVAIAGAAHLLAVADYADLDGNWLLADHPFAPDPLQGAEVGPPPGVGLGVEPTADLFPRPPGAPPGQGPSNKPS